MGIYYINGALSKLNCYALYDSNVKLFSENLEEQQRLYVESELIFNLFFVQDSFIDYQNRNRYTVWHICGEIFLGLH